MKISIGNIVTVAVMAGLAGCALVGAPATPGAAAVVQARGETTPVGTANDDAADDPAVWRNANNPSASLIIGTDKKAGLYVYNLNGQVLDFVNAGNVNNVDLREGVTINGSNKILVVASDRNDLANSKLALFSLEPTTGKLITLGTVSSGTGEAYGVCLSRDATGLYAFTVAKDGTINQVKLDVTGPSPSGRIVRTLKLNTQSEGCVVDEVTGRLYVAEEDIGLWRFDARVSGPANGVKIASADGKNIAADAEGVALADDPKAGRFIIVSSQGDNAYAVYSAETEAFVGQFKISASRAGSTEETDGIDVLVGDFGPDYPGGIFIAQDGQNAPRAQNFKLVAWDDIKQALGLNPK